MSESESELNNLDIIDTTWIDEFEKEEKDYLNYYNENITYLNICYIYVNIDSEIYKIKEEKITLSKENCLQKNELIGLIKNNIILNGSKYSLLLLLKYNILLVPTELKTFLKNKNLTNSNNYLTSIVNIEDIVFEKTITMFHDINSLFIVFYKKPHLNCNLLDSSNFNNATKKVFLNSKSKKLNKTIKKTT
jgi:hypothetical protein